MIRPVGPAPTIDPAHQNEQGQGLAKPHPKMGPGTAPLPDIQSPLGDTSGVSAGSSQPSSHLNPHQFPNSGEPEEGAAEGAEGAEGAAAAAGEGIGSLADLAALFI